MHPKPENRDDAGIGLVEIVVSMLLFALLMATAAPLFVGSVRSSARSAQVASASQIASQQVERARSAATSCAAYTAFLTVAPAPLPDSRGIVFTIDQTPSTSVTCPPAGGGLVDFDVTVTAEIPGRPVSSHLSTAIWVAS
ncbi:hypothetical protein QUV83_03965 [Cellulomonas cellasea]|uniref:hypothetical protein n=1 Tax=Cellulomonas cellasea TaxID=43670 RepID=UPI0025A411CF|nr:hypothetical protein [Cellulomonas cellasea]MDM8083923.1 hypothetical protein [Cellulomonas cellasea]